MTVGKSSNDSNGNSYDKSMEICRKKVSNDFKGKSLKFCVLKLLQIVKHGIEISQLISDSLLGPTRITDDELCDTLLKYNLITSVMLETIINKFLSEDEINK